MKKIKNTNNFTNLLWNFPAASCSRIMKHVVFLDIETTGFSPADSRLYLAGTAYFEEDMLVTEQFFAESAEEEAALLSELDQFLRRFDTIITFHGKKFDLPFLEGRRGRTDAFSGSSPQTVNSDPNLLPDRRVADLYRDFSAYRHIFQLENYKQKTLESFAGFCRTDSLDGGALIKIYQEYLKNPDPEMLRLILKHNYEDLLGMAHLLSLYAFDGFFRGNFSVTGRKTSAYTRIDGTKGLELSITCLLEHPLPVSVSCSGGLYYLHAEKDRAFLRVPVFQGTLKYFYPDYENYYYLPGEDTAIHKSVAAYVEKAHRKKARACECFTKRTGQFLPQYEELITPSFYQEYKDAVSYFEMPDTASESASEIDLLKKYCLHMLAVLKAGK